MYDPLYGVMEEAQVGELVPFDRETQNRERSSQGNEEISASNRREDKAIKVTHVNCSVKEAELYPIALHSILCLEPLIITQGLNKGKGLVLFDYEDKELERNSLDLDVNLNNLMA